MQCSNQTCLNQLNAHKDANFPCPYCKIVEYCSPNCRQLDWNTSHQSKCNGLQVGASMTSLDTSGISIEGGRKRQKTFSDFEIVKESDKTNSDLGKGAFGQVKLVREKARPEKKYAMKVISKKQLMAHSNIDYLIREIKIHKKLDHPYIIKLHYFFEDKDNAYLIMEYAENSNLFFYVRRKKKLTEKEAFILFAQTCLGIDYLHKKNILHRDLKPENLLLDIKGNIKICDFGWSAEDVGKRNTFCGTVDYMAPEMVQNKPHDYKIDIWSVGVLLYELLHGYPPFKGKNNNEKFQSILEKELKFQGVSFEAQDLISSLLRTDPIARPDFETIFEHPWIKKYEKEFNMSVKSFVIDPSKKKTKESSKSANITPRSQSPLPQIGNSSSNALNMVSPEMTKKDHPSENILDSNQAHKSISQISTNILKYEHKSQSLSPVNHAKDQLHSQKDEKLTPFTTNKADEQLKELSSISRRLSPSPERAFNKDGRAFNQAFNSNSGRTSPLQTPKISPNIDTDPQGKTATHDLSLKQNLSQSSSFVTTMLPDQKSHIKDLSNISRRLSPSPDRGRGREVLTSAANLNQNYLSLAESSINTGRTDSKPQISNPIQIEKDSTFQTTSNMSSFVVGALPDQRSYLKDLSSISRRLSPSPDRVAKTGDEKSTAQMNDLNQFNSSKLQTSKTSPKFDTNHQSDSIQQTKTTKNPQSAFEILNSKAAESSGQSTNQKDLLVYSQANIFQSPTKNNFGDLSNESSLISSTNLIKGSNKAEEIINNLFQQPKLRENSKSPSRGVIFAPIKEHNAFAQGVASSHINDEIFKNRKTTQEDKLTSNNIDDFKRNTTNNASLATTGHRTKFEIDYPSHPVPDSSSTSKAGTFYNKAPVETLKETSTSAIPINIVTNTVENVNRTERTNKFLQDLGLKSLSPNNSKDINAATASVNPLVEDLLRPKSKSPSNIQIKEAGSYLEQEPAKGDYKNNAIPKQELSLVGSHVNKSPGRVFETNAFEIDPSSEKKQPHLATNLREEKSPSKIFEVKDYSKQKMENELSKYNHSSYQITNQEPVIQSYQTSQSNSKLNKDDSSREIENLNKSPYHRKENIESPSRKIFNSEKEELSASKTPKQEIFEMKYKTEETSKPERVAREYQRPEMILPKEGDFFVPEGDSIEIMLSALEGGKSNKILRSNKQPEHQFIVHEESRDEEDGEHGEVRISRVTKLLERSHFAEVDQIMDRLFKEDESIISHNESVDQKLRKKGIMKKAVTFEETDESIDEGASQIKKFSPMKKVYNNETNESPGKIRQVSPYREGATDQWRVTNIDKYLASYEIENTEENKILDMLETYYSTGKLEEKEKQRYPKRPENENFNDISLNESENKVIEMSFQTDKARDHSMSFGKDGVEDPKKAAKQLREQINEEQEEDDSQEGYGWSKKMKNKSSENKIKPKIKEDVNEKSAKDIRYKVIQKDQEQSVENESQDRSDEEENGESDEDEKPDKGIVADRRGHLSTSQQIKIKNNPKASKYNDDHDDDENEESKELDYKKDKKGLRNGPFSPMKPNKNKAEQQSDEEIDTTLKGSRQKSDQISLKVEKRLFQKKSLSMSEKRASEEQKKLKKKDLTDQKDLQIDRKNRSRNLYSEKELKKLGGGSSYENHTYHVMKQFRSKLNEKYGLNIDSPTKKDGENGEDDTEEEEEEEIYNRKRFNSNRRGEFNGSEEDEREQKENWPRFARQFHSEKKDRSARDFDLTVDEVLARDRSRNRDEDYLRLKEDARKKELELQYYKDKLQATKYRSIDDSYDQVRKRTQHLQFLIDQMDYENSQTVSRPSYRAMREIPRRYDESTGRDEDTGFLSKLTSIFGCLDRNEKKPQKFQRRDGRGNNY